MLNKNHWTLLIWNQRYLKCSGGYVPYQEIQGSGKENGMLIQYSNHNYKVDLNNFGNCT